MRFQPVDRFIDLVRHRAPADLPGARLRELAPTRDGRPLLAVVVPGTSERAAVLGYPHPAEPLAQLAWDELSQLIRSRQVIGGDGHWLVVPAWDAAGARAADPAWQAAGPLLETLAVNWVRPAPELQVEWSFPVEIEGQRFDTPLPETAAVQDALSETAPQFLFSLHNSLFPDGYVLVSDELAECAGTLGGALERAGVGRRDPCPIPYVPDFGTGVYGLPGIRREWAYRISQDAGATLRLDHGAASFDICATSLSCVIELPLLAWRGPDPSLGLLAQAEPRLWAVLFDLCERLLPSGTSGLDAEAAYLLSSPRYLRATAAATASSIATITDGGSPPARQLAARVCGGVFTVASNIAMLQRGLGMPVTFPEPVRDALAVADGLVRWHDQRTLARCLADCLNAVLSIPNSSAEDS